MMPSQHLTAKRTTRTLLWTILRIATGLIWIAPVALAQSRPANQSASTWRQKDTEWASYSADVRGTRYRPLDQIDASNFSKLEIAWRFKTDHLGPFPEYKLEGTPVGSQNRIAPQPYI